MIREQAPHTQQLRDQPQDLARLFFEVSMAYEAVKEIARQMGVTISDLLPREPDIYDPDDYR